MATKKTKGQVATAQLPDDKLGTPVVQDVTPPAPDADIDSIGDALAEQAPSVNPGVIEAERAEAELKAKATQPPSPAVQMTQGQRVDTRNRKVQFDPSIHEADANGKPILTEKGRFKKKPGVYGAATKTLKTPQNTPLNPAMAGSQENNATATIATDFKTSLLATLISDEFNLEQGERAAEIASLEAVLNHYSPNGVPMHPLALYAIISGSNVIKRFAKPESKAKTWWQRTRAKLAAKYAAWKYGPSYEGKTKDAAHADSGKNNVGENNAGNSVSENAIIPPWAPVDNLRP